MAIHVDVPEYGTFIEFPDNTDPAEIERVVSQNFPPKSRDPFSVPQDEAERMKAEFIAKEQGDPGMWEKTKDFVKRSIVPVPAATVATMQKGLGGFNQWLGETVVPDALGGAALAEAGKQFRDEGDMVLRQIEKENPTTPGGWDEATRSALVSTGMQVPAFAAGVLTGGGATVPLAAMGAQTAGEKYGEMRGKGFNPMQSGIAAAGHGIVEVATEKFPTEKVFELMKRPILKTLGQLYGGELVGEAAATFGQDLIDKGYVKPGMTDAEVADSVQNYFTSGEAAANQIATAKSTLIQSSLMGGGAAAIGHATKPKRVDPGPAVDPFLGIDDQIPEPSGPLSGAIQNVRGQGLSVMNPEAPLPGDREATRAKLAEQLAATERQYPGVQEAPQEEVLSPETVPPREQPLPPVPSSTMRVTPEGNVIPPQAVNPMMQGLTPGMQQGEVQAARERLQNPAAFERGFTLQGDSFNPDVVVPDEIIPPTREAQPSALVFDAERPVAGLLPGRQEPNFVMRGEQAQLPEPRKQLPAQTAAMVNERGTVVMPEQINQRLQVPEMTSEEVAASRKKLANPNAEQHAAIHGELSQVKGKEFTAALEQYPAAAALKMPRLSILAALKTAADGRELSAKQREIVSAFDADVVAKREVQTRPPSAEGAQESSADHSEETLEKVSAPPVEVSAVPSVQTAAGAVPVETGAAPVNQPSTKITPEKQAVTAKSDRNAVDPIKDDIVKAISKLGGLDLAEASREWGETITDSAKDLNRKGVFGKPVFRKNGGRSIDKIAEGLVQHGYLKADENGKWDQNELMEALRESAAGGRVLTSQGQEEALAQSQDMTAFSDDELEAAGYNDLTEAAADAVESAINDLADLQPEELAQAKSELFSFFDEVANEETDVQRGNEEAVPGAPAGRAEEGRAGGEESRQPADEGSAERVRFEKTPEGDQGKLFATPPTFGKKAQGPNVTTEEMPLYSEPLERAEERKQGDLLSPEEDTSRFKLYPPTTSGLTVAEVEAAIKSLGGTAEVVATAADLPPALANDLFARSLAGHVRGVYHEGKIYLVAGNIETKDEAGKVYLHEAVGHMGVRKVLGESLTPVLDQIVLAYGKKGLADIARRYGLDLDNREQRRVAAEEKLAELAETNEKPTILDKAIIAFRKWLREHGFNSLKWTTSEIKDLLARSKQAVMGNGPLGDIRVASPKQRENVIKDAEKVAQDALVRGDLPAWAEAQRRLIAAYDAMVEKASPGGEVMYSLADSLTSSEAFKRWFGDSKVVDENGEPLVVYHGTKTDFANFRDDMPIGMFSDASAEMGIWFATDRARAERYARSGGVVKEVFLALRNPMVVKVSDLPRIARLGKEHAIRKGHDGLIVKSPDGTVESYVAFYVRQIQVRNDGFVESPISDADKAKYAHERCHALTSALLKMSPWGEAVTVAAKDNPSDIFHSAFRIPNTQIYVDAEGAYDGRIPFEKAMTKYTNGGAVVVTSANESQIHRLVSGDKSRAISQAKRVASDLLRWSDGIASNDPSNPDIRYSLRPDIKEAIAKFDAGTMTKSLLLTLHPADFSRFRKFTEDNLRPEIQDAIAYFLANPFFQAERDPLKRPYYETAAEREVNRMDDMLAMFGGLEEKDGKKKTVKERLSNLIKWKTEHLTKWETLRQDFDAMTKEQKAAFDLLTVEGDVYTQRYESLEEAKKNPRLKNVDEKVFGFYQKYLAQLDQTNEAKIAIVKRSMEEAGLDKEKIEGHIAEYRNYYRERPGWRHRDHGEGSFTVNVYHSLQSLDLKVERTAEGFRVRLPFYPGGKVKQALQKIATENGGKLRVVPTGAIQMDFKTDPGVAVRQMKALKLTDENDEPVRVKVYAKFFPTKAKAEAHLKELKENPRAFMPHNYREGEKYDFDPVGRADQIDEQMFQSKSGDIAMEQIILKGLEKAKQRGEITDAEYGDIKESLIQNTAETLLGRGAGLYQIRRAEYLIEGYQQDETVELYENYVHGTAGMLSKARYALQQFKHLQNAPGEVKPWAFRYVQDSLRNMGALDRMSANARAFATLWYLAFKPASVVINSTQTYTLGFAELGRYTKNPLATITKAQKDIFTDNLTDDEKKVFLTNIYLTQERETAAAELAGRHEGVKKWVAKATDITLSWFQKVEVLNRKTMILSAYRAFKAKGDGFETALDKAMMVNSTVNFDMGRQNLPGFARNPFGRTVYALQSFTWNTMNYLYNRATSGEKEQIRALGRLAEAWVVLGGLFALPGGDELDKFLRWLTKKDYRLEMRRWTKEHAAEYGTPGELLNAFVWHGLPGTAGVNISNSLVFRIPMLSNWLSGDDVSMSMLGVFSGLMQKVGMAAKAAGKGDIYRAAENLAPEAARGPMSAIRQYNRGATTLGGKPIFHEGKAMKITGAEAATRFVGLQPLRTSEISEVREAEMALKEKWGERRQDALDSYRINRKLKTIQEFNQSLKKSQAKDLVRPITMETIRRALSPKADKGATAFENEY